MNKKIIIAALALVAVVAALLAVYFLVGPGKQIDSGATTGTNASGEIISGCFFSVVVIHADGSEKTFSYIAEEDGTLGDFLEAEGVIESEGADDGMFHTVDGEKADWNANKSYWAFYIEDQYAMTGIYDTTITDCTVYRLVYTIG